MADAGYNASIVVGGTSTAFTNEATTKVTANTVYRLTDTTKRVLDPTVAVTVEVDPLGTGVWGAGAGYALDYFSGTVTFTADQGANALVRVSGSYIPHLTVATGRSMRVTLEREALDATVFGDGWRDVLPGLGRLSASIDVLETMLTDHDPGAGTQRFADKLTGGTVFLVVLRTLASGRRIATWCHATRHEQAVDIAGLLTGTLDVVSTSSGEAARWGYYIDT